MWSLYCHLPAWRAVLWPCSSLLQWPPAEMSPVSPFPVHTHTHEHYINQPVHIWLTTECRLIPFTTFMAQMSPPIRRECFVSILLSNLGWTFCLVSVTSRSTQTFLSKSASHSLKYIMCYQEQKKSISQQRQSLHQSVFPLFYFPYFFRFCALR